MATYSTKDQVTALLGLLQAASIAHRIATFGTVNENDLYTAIKSIFCTSPKTVIDTYGNYLNLTNGQKILDAITNKNPKVLRSNVLKYALSMYAINKKLQKNKQIVLQISEGIEKIRESYSLDIPLNPNLIERINNLYLNTISKITPRIMVTGNANYLKNLKLTYKVRCALLSGIRSALLWFQCGGRLWHLIFCNSRIKRALELCKKES